MDKFLVAYAMSGFLTLFVSTFCAKYIVYLGFPLPHADKRLGNIDGLRGYVALAVMIHHFFLWVQVTRVDGLWVPPAINVINQLGAGGVGLFFMTTGFVFYPRILRGFTATSWPSIYITRVFRIMPLVVASVAVITLIIMLRTGRTPGADYPLVFAQWISSWNAPDMLGYPNSRRVNASVLWSLWYEWLFYLAVLPVCAATMDIVRYRKLPTWSVPVMLFGFAFGLRVVVWLIGYWIDGLIYLPLFAVGMLAYEIQARTKFKAALSTPRIAIVAVGGLILGMIATPFPYLLSLPLFGFFFICVACGNDIGGLLRGRGALALGECSFSIYLLHGIMLSILFVDLGNLHRWMPLSALPILLPMAAVVVVMVTATSYLLIERPAVRQGKRVVEWWAGRRVRLDRRELEVAP